MPILPDPHLTPGATDSRVTQENIHQTICVPDYTARVRPSSSRMRRIKRQVLADYGISGIPLADFELDHLISLELGGAPDDVLNLWPEVYERSGRVRRGTGAETKDKLEDRLHRLVCAGRMSLEEAQRSIAGDWLAAWRALN
jgi:hypothetical protein